MVSHRHVDDGGLHHADTDDARRELGVVSGEQQAHLVGPRTLVRPRRRAPPARGTGRHTWRRRRGRSGGPCSNSARGDRLGVAVHRVFAWMPSVGGLPHTSAPSGANDQRARGLMGRPTVQPIVTGPKDWSHWPSRDSSLMSVTSATGHRAGRRPRSARTMSSSWRRCCRCGQRPWTWRTTFRVRLDAIPEPDRPSGRNLVHYLALRQHDLRDLQGELAA